MPMTVTPSRATNLRNMSMSFTRVPSRVDKQFIKVTRNRPTSATPLLTQGLMVSASAPIKALTRYSPMMMEMMAELPGFSTRSATQVKRNPAISPKILDR